MARLAMVVGRNGVEEAREAVKPFREPDSEQSWFGLLGASNRKTNTENRLGRPVSGCRLSVRESDAQLKWDASGMRSDVLLVTLALRGIFRVAYWAPFGASVIR
ncbi:hypothetical protein CRG98_022478 [Punica granatum]|uniref:Uncharacterized protein n=1 Tax=Punica granatum TaxID=22663 RepID=A0A2I0JLN9_PUNGR|nr:hypothetical protein CRG98_022478 [Punica granatum]